MKKTLTLVIKLNIKVIKMNIIIKIKIKKNTHKQHAVVTAEEYTHLAEDVIKHYDLLFHWHKQIVTNYKVANKE